MRFNCVQLVKLLPGLISDEMPLNFPLYQCIISNMYNWFAKQHKINVIYMKIFTSLFTVLILGIEISAQVKFLVATYNCCSGNRYFTWLFINGQLSLA